MAALTLEKIWEPEITQIETTDPVEGGPSGVDNRAPRQLGNRTVFLEAITLCLPACKRRVDPALLLFDLGDAMTEIPNDHRVPTKTSLATMHAKVSTSLYCEEGGDFYDALPDTVAPIDGDIHGPEVLEPIIWRARAKGAKGKDGKDGKDGNPGKDGDKKQDAWPVGAIYHSANGMSPALILGFGTWISASTKVAVSGGATVWERTA
jgi:hypothetical protein